MTPFADFLGSATRTARALSLGAGVQSSWLQKLSDDGDIPRFDISIFADTKHEPQHTTTPDPATGQLITGGVYGFLDWLETGAKNLIHRISAGDLMADAMEIRVSGKTGKRYMKGLIPAYLADENGKKTGLLGRKCTVDYKVRAIHKHLRELFAARYKDWRKVHAKELKAWAAHQEEMKLYKLRCKWAKENRHTYPSMPHFPRAEWDVMQNAALVEMVIGISYDEVDRMKASREPWIRNYFPLIARRETRQDCKNGMSARGYPIPPRSACKQCPFHSDEEWANLKENSPIDFAAAVATDYELRAAAAQQDALKGVPFLHESLLPLDQVDFKTTGTPGHAQLNLFRSECEGLCGV